MTSSLVNLNQSKSNESLKTAYYPTLYNAKIIVDTNNPKILVLDKFGQDSIFKPDEIYFIEDVNKYSKCPLYCEKHDITMKDLFKKANSITFVADKKRIAPALSSMQVVTIILKE